MSWLKANSRGGPQKSHGAFCSWNEEESNVYLHTPLQSPVHSYKCEKCIKVDCRVHFIVYTFYGVEFIVGVSNP
jgi:hypothetical protein